MKFREVVWRHQFVEKIKNKHLLDPHEVEEVLQRRPLVRRQERGHRPGQDLYAVYGQTESGRKVVAFVIRIAPLVAMPVSARDMTSGERSYYAKHRRNP